MAPSEVGALLGDLAATLRTRHAVLVHSPMPLQHQSPSRSREVLAHGTVGSRGAPRRSGSDSSDTARCARALADATSAPISQPEPGGARSWHRRKSGRSSEIWQRLFGHGTLCSCTRRCHFSTNLPAGAGRCSLMAPSEVGALLGDLAATLRTRHAVLVHSPMPL